MKKIAILLTVLMLAVIFAGCAQESAEDTELDPEIAELFDELNDDNDTEEEPTEPDLPDDTGTDSDYEIPDTDNNDQGTYSEPEPTPSSGIQLVQYDGGFFSVLIPAGWTIQPMGQYTDFSFRAWDPQNPDYEIFYYGSLSPFNRSYQTMEWNRNAAAMATGPNPYAVFGDAPLIDETDVGSMFFVWNEYANLVATYAGSYMNLGFSFPAMYDLEVREEIPVSTYFSSIASSEAIVLADFTSAAGTQCTGKLFASLIPSPSYVEGGVDQSWVEAVGVTGVLAPADAFEGVEEILTQAAFSLQFSDAYMAEAQTYAQAQTTQALAENAILQMTYDTVNAAWSARFRYY